MAGRKVRVLVADDELHIQELLSWIMDSLGAEVQTAADGKQALDLYPLFKPDIVLLDVNMPHLDGVSVLKEIIKTTPNAIVVMLTAMNNVEIIEECINAGAFNYLLKDATAEELHNTLTELWQTCVTELKNRIKAKKLAMGEESAK